MTAVLATLRSDLVAALKAGDATRTAALRVALAAVANAEAVDSSGPTTAVGRAGDVARREFDEAAVLSVLAAERDDLRQQAAVLRSRCRADAALELDARATVLSAYVFGTDEPAGPVAL